MTIGDLDYRCDASRSALVVVDMQLDFCNPRGETSGPDFDAMTAVVDRTNALIDGAHEAGVPVIFIRTNHDDATNTVAWLTRRGEPRAKEKCVPGTPGVEFYGVTPTEVDFVVTKYRYSAFVGTPLEMTLHRLGRESVVVTGVATNACVQYTAAHALCLDFLVTIAEDCCTTSSKDRHAAAIDSMAGSIGLVAQSEQIAAIWEATSSTAFDPLRDPIGRLVA